MEYCYEKLSKKMLYFLYRVNTLKNLMFLGPYEEYGVLMKIRTSGPRKQPIAFLLLFATLRWQTTAVRLGFVQMAQKYSRYFIYIVFFVNFCFFCGGGYLRPTGRANTVYLALRKTKIS